MWWLVAFCLVEAPDTFRVPLAPAESLAVTTVGAGTPVVLIPGLFGSAFGYRKLLPLLSESGFRAIVIEPLGIGSSSRPEGADYSLTAQADRLAAVLDTLGVTESIVVAHAIGAAIAFRLAYRRPDLVRGLVSLEGGPVESAVTPGFRRAMKFAPWLKLLGGVELVRAQVRRYLIAASGDTTWVNEETLRGYTAAAEANLGATLKAYREMADAQEPEPLEPRLGEIRSPVRLMVGAVAHESEIPADEVARMRRGLLFFDVDTLPGTGHFVYEERPQAVVAAASRLASPDVPQSISTGRVELEEVP